MVQTSTVTANIFYATIVPVDFFPKKFLISSNILCGGVQAMLAAKVIRG